LDSDSDEGKCGGSNGHRKRKIHGVILSSLLIVLIKGIVVCLDFVELEHFGSHWLNLLMHSSGSWCRCGLQLDRGLRERLCRLRNGHRLHGGGCGSCREGDRRHRGLWSGWNDR
jgi:hypothetical protein